MKKVTDLTPRFKNLRSAEQEFMIPYLAGERPMGESAGGLALYSNKFKRGYGNKVFGSDENGIWLGAAEFPDAPFSVDMEGNVIAESIFLASSAFFASGTGVGTLFTTEADVPSTSLSITFSRAQRILVLVNILGAIENAGGAGDWTGSGLIRLYVDGVDTKRTLLIGGLIGTDKNGAVNVESASMHHLGVLAAGAHTLKLTAACDQGSGSTRLKLHSYSISYTTLGNSTA